jgi:iron complex outermembrane receptor protein
MLNRFFALNTLMPLTALIAVANPSYGDSSTSPSDQKHKGHEHIEEVIVSASPISHAHSDNARAIAVINGDKLRTQAASTLAQTLTSQVGVSSSSFGNSVGNPIIRGQSASRVKVMQDNQDTLDASNTSADHANTTEPLLADQIEILRGPATLRFGNGAIGGVVNVIDGRIPVKKTGVPVSAAIETRHSNNNGETASVFRIDAENTLFSWHLDGLYRDSNDIYLPVPAHLDEADEGSEESLDNSNARAHAVTVGGSWIGEKGFIGMAFNQQENQYGIPAGAHDHGAPTPEPPIRIDMNQKRFDLKSELRDPIDNIEKVTLRLSHNNYQHMELEGSEIGTTFTNDAWEARIEATHAPTNIGPSNNWHGAVGLHHTRRDYRAAGEEAFIPAENDVQNTGVFWIEEKHWQDRESPQWIEIGVRAEQQSIDTKGSGSNNSITHNSTSLSFAYHINFQNVHHASISLGHAERAPSLEELFSDGAHIATSTYDLGNSKLNNETSNNLDLGYQWQPSGESAITRFKANVFYNTINDYIYQHDTGTTDVDSSLPILAYSQQQADFYGVEIELSADLTDSIEVRLFSDAVRAKFNDGSNVPRLPPSRIGTEVTWFQSDWSASFQLIANSAQNRPGENETKTDGYTRLNAQVNIPLKLSSTDGLIFIKANNLLNEEIRHSTSFLRDIAPEAGRGITTGIRVSF